MVGANICRRPIRTGTRAGIAAKKAIGTGNAPRRTRARAARQSSGQDPGPKRSRMMGATTVVKRAIGLRAVVSEADLGIVPGVAHRVDVPAKTGDHTHRGGLGAAKSAQGPKTDGMGPGTGVLDLMDPRGGPRNPRGTGLGQSRLGAMTRVAVRVSNGRGLAR